MKKNLKRNLGNILLVVISFFIAYFFITKFKFMYGSKIDWLHQHVAVPDYFRNLFYKTHDLFPDFAFNLGSGQNIYNLSYYGLLSPIILFSYLLPFIAMPDYIAFSTIILIISSSILMYFFIKRKTNDKIALICSIIFLFATPMIFHSHRHIMFVNYMPFLVMGYIAVDNYFHKNKKICLTLSVFLMIMTSYFFSVGGIISLVIYGIYCYLEKNKNVSFKSFILEGIKFLIPIIIGVLMSAILIVPTFYSLSVGREVAHSSNILNLLLPELKLWDILYSSYSLGLCSLAVLGLIYGLLSKKKNSIFLSVMLLILLTFPVCKYLLNGGLYLENKVLIPFLPLFIVMISNTLKDILEKRVKINLIFKLTIIFCSCLLVFDDVSFVIPLIVDLILIYICLRDLDKNKKYRFFYLLFLPFLIFCVTSISLRDELVSRRDDVNYELVDKILDSDDSFYRINIYEDKATNSNHIYDMNYYTSSIYSSSSSLLYEDFYYNRIGNEITHETYRIMDNTNNLFYNMYLGNKYIISKNIVPRSYVEVDRNIYKNDKVYSVGYATNELMSVSSYNKLSYPDNIYAYLKYTIVEDDPIKTNFKSPFKKVDLDYDVINNDVDVVQENDHYLINVKKRKSKIKLKLNNDFKDKILLISFDMNYQESCDVGDTYISINGIKNQLSCKEWKYNNYNYKFEYVLNDDLKELDIRFSRGKFDISNILVYVIDEKDIDSLADNINPFVIDRDKTSGDNIYGSIDVLEDSYFNISIPYDEGFKIYVDDCEIEYEKVDFDFIGFPIKKGHHDITIKYEAPFKKEGIILSLIGLVLFLLEIGLTILKMVIDEIKNPTNSLFKFISDMYFKYQEIINYLIVGGLTTAVSLAVKWGLLFTILHPENAFELQLAIITSSVCATLFAYVANRMFVFCSKNKNILKEMFHFFSARVATLIMEMVIMWFFVTLLKLNTDMWVLFWTIVVQVIVIVANYIFSKLFVFKKK